MALKDYTIAELEERIDLLSQEIWDNEDENRGLQDEIERIFAHIKERQ